MWKYLLPIPMGVVGCSAAPYVPPNDTTAQSGSPDTPAPQVTKSEGADPAGGQSDVPLDLGAVADVLCVVQSATGLMHGYCTPPLNPSAPPVVCDPTASGVLPVADAELATGFVLYVNSSGRWELYTEGHPFSVTVACIQWNALGLQAAPEIVSVEAAATYATSGDTTSTTPAASPTQGACVLSSATDAYDNKAGAQLTSTGLAVHGNGYNWLWSSATCFGEVPFADFPANTALPANAFCGLSQLGDMSQTDSSVSAAGPTVTAVHASGTARCFAVR
jgi:hypothetical protein